MLYLQSSKQIQQNNVIALRRIKEILFAYERGQQISV